MNIKQKGYTLTEIMIAVGVVATLVIGGMNFYNHAIMKAQAVEAFPAAKIVIDDVIDYYARFSSMPDDNENLGGTYIPAGDGYIANARWDRGDNATGLNINTPGTEGAAWGMVTVTFRAVGVQQALAGEHVKFYLIESAYRSYLEYHGCTTSIKDGQLDSSQMANGTNDLGDASAVFHPILPQCLFHSLGVAEDAASNDLDVATNFPTGKTDL
jgi:prepilin-type N-terminal cleavage/methylation domain-containing protein